jgi:hypothetical protein
MDDTKVKTISLEAFKQDEQLILQSGKKLITDNYIQTVQDLLVDAPYCYSEEDASETARCVIEHGEQLYDNADMDSDSEDEGDEDNQINCLGSEYGSLYERSFCLINAPKSSKQTTFENDEKSRKLQYDNFAQIYPELRMAGDDADDSKCVRVDCTVKDSKELNTGLEHFFKEEACKSVIAIVAFNGHGSRKGLYLDQDGSIPLDEFLENIQAMLSQHRSKTGLPHMVKVVFAQCYGHLHTEPDQCDIEVISFTTDKAPKTHSRIQFDKLNQQQVEDSNQIQLNYYAKMERRKSDLLEQLRDLHLSEDGSKCISLQPQTSITIEEDVAPVFY